MSQSHYSDETLVVVGAGPKGLAIATKAVVLKKLGFKPPKIIILEKNEVAHHWLEGSNYTNGKLPLGTSPHKDIGFPYYSFCWGDKANKRINYLMQRYSWQSFLVAKHRYAEWIDRGSPAPKHRDWAEYLNWVFHYIESEIDFRRLALKQLEIQNSRWRIETSDPKTTLEADGIVFTGPGIMKPPFDIPNHPRVLTYADFWKNHREILNFRNVRIALVGAGENSATIAVTLGQADESVLVDVITPSATTYTRGESYVENHLYTDPFQGNWLQLTRQDRIDFIQRTDRGVFSVTTKQELDQLANIEMIPGLFRSVTIDKMDQLVVEIEYNQDKERRIYDYVILAIGFNHTQFVGDFLSDNAKQEILNNAGISEWSHSAIEDSIDENLAIEGCTPSLHLPMLAGLNQGPGFANLSCLGRLSDHILARYINIGSSSILGGPVLLTLTDSEMNLDDPTL